MLRACVKTSSFIQFFKACLRSSIMHYITAPKLKHPLIIASFCKEHFSKKCCGDSLFPSCGKSFYEFSWTPPSYDWTTIQVGFAAGWDCCFVFHLPSFSQEATIIIGCCIVLFGLWLSDKAVLRVPLTCVWRLLTCSEENSKFFQVNFQFYRQLFEGVHYVCSLLDSGQILLRKILFRCFLCFWFFSKVWLACSSFLIKSVPFLCL